jgi:hypothetical protein
MTTARAMMAIWRGPFAIGPLTRPVSVGDALAKVLEVCWKLVLILACSVAAIVAFAVGQPALENTFRTDLTKKVTMSLVLDPKECSAQGSPLKATITNNSRASLGRVTFHIGVREVNHSTDLNAGALESYSDVVLAPKYWQTRCYPLPETNAAAGSPLAFSAELRAVEPYTGP